MAPLALRERPSRPTNDALSPSTDPEAPFPAISATASVVALMLYTRPPKPGGPTHSDTNSIPLLNSTSVGIRNAAAVPRRETVETNPGEAKITRCTVPVGLPAPAMYSVFPARRMADGRSKRAAAAFPSTALQSLRLPAIVVVTSVAKLSARSVHVLYSAT
jgi:hypothetical protein